MFAALVLLSCTVGVRSVLYIGNSGSIVLGWSFHQPVAILKSRRQPQVVLNSTKPPRTFLLARCGTAVTCPEPDAVQEAELERKTLGVSLEKVEHRYQPKNLMVLFLFPHCSLLLRLHLKRCCEGSLACGPYVWLTRVKNYEKSICSRCFFHVDIYKVIYCVIGIAKECPINHPLLTSHQAPGGPCALVGALVQDLQERFRVRQPVLMCGWEVVWVTTECVYSSFWHVGDFNAVKQRFGCQEVLLACLLM